ncbi:MAG: CopG family transcriptional regulator [Deltaproteobacteria bacterium]|nr:CopG family transcriptional regulator [Deltaproteobacteria bacterium]
MIRTQIQMTEGQVEKLKKMASMEHRSMADLIRQAVDGLVAAKSGINTEERRARAIAAAGRFHSNISDLSASHDAHLAKAYGK